MRHAVRSYRRSLRGAKSGKGPECRRRGREQKRKIKIFREWITNGIVVVALQNFEEKRLGRKNQTALQGERRKRRAQRSKPLLGEGAKEISRGAEGRFELYPSMIITVRCQAKKRSVTVGHRGRLRVEI